MKKIPMPHLTLELYHEDGEHITNWSGEPAELIKDLPQIKEYLEGIIKEQKENAD